MLRVVEVPAGQRDPYRPLMELADDSEAEIKGYRERGVLFGLEHAEGGAIRGMVLVDAYDPPPTMRLLSVAIAQDHQRRGLGTQLVQQVLDRLRARGCRRVVVSTASSSVGVLAFYQRLGFRMLKIERDWFCPERGYPAGLEENGIPVRDRVWFDRAP